jgi:hypothetical protein
MCGGSHLAWELATAREFPPSLVKAAVAGIGDPGWMPFVTCSGRRVGCNVTDSAGDTSAKGRTRRGEPATTARNSQIVSRVPKSPITDHRSQFKTATESGEVSEWGEVSVLEQISPSVARCGRLRRQQSQRRHNLRNLLLLPRRFRREGVAHC